MSKNMSNVKKLNRWTMDALYKKNNNLTWRVLKANEVKFKVTYEDHPKYSKSTSLCLSLTGEIQKSRRLDVLYLGHVNKLNRIRIQIQSEPFWNFCMIEESVRSRSESISTNVDKPLGTQKISCIELDKIHSHTLFATFCWNCLNM